MHHLSAALCCPSVHHSTCYTICPSTHPSLFHSLSLRFIFAQFLFLSGFNLLVDTTLMSVCPCKDNIASYLMSWWCNYRCKYFRNQIGSSGHLTAIFVFAADWHDLHVSVWGKNKSVLQVAVKRWFRVDVLTFVERKRGRENPRRKQQKASAP